MQSPTLPGSRAVGQRALKVDRAPALCAGGSGFWKDNKARAFSEDGGLLKLELHCAPMYVSEQQELGPTSWHACLQRWHLRYTTCARQLNATFFIYLVPEPIINGTVP